MAGLFDSDRAARFAPGSDTDQSSKWLDSIITPDSGRAAGVGDSNKILNAYGRMTPPLAVGPKGRGETTTVLKDILRDDQSGDLRMPSSKPTPPRYPSR